MTSVGVLLAAGTGSRFEGGNKLRQPVDGEPVVRHAARRLAASPVEETVVVLGHDAASVRAELRPLADRLSFVHNERYAEGQSTSARLGAREVLERGGTLGVFALGDMPWVAPETYERLVTTATRCEAPVVVPVADGQRGNPVAFDATALREFTALAGDAGGRTLFDSFPVERLSVDDTGIHADVDTRADLER